MDASSPTPVAPLCRGLHCMDRDACFVYDDVTKVALVSHESSACDVHAATDTLTLPYITRHGETIRISVEQAQLLMKCTYTSKLLFQSAHMLRNYAFWGFTGTVDEGFPTVAMAPTAWSVISCDVAIGHASALDSTVQDANKDGGDESDNDNGLGLFATAALALDLFLGEYTGMVQVNADTTTRHDPYGLCYPSAYERSEVQVSALEFGNEIRCINHSDQPNARFTPMIRRGVLHIYCFTTRAVASGEQIFVDYGPSYWIGSGIEPVVC